MKLAVSLALQKESVFAPFTPQDFDAGLRWAQSLGVDGVELIIQHPDRVDTDALNKQLGGYGLAVATIATGQMAGEGLMFTEEDPETRNQAVARICAHIDLSTRIGNPNVTIGLARGIGSKDPEILKKQYRHVEDCVKRCGDHAAQKGVTINLEPLNRYETNILHTSEETLAMINVLGCADSVGILYDTFHSNIEDADMAGTVDTYCRNICHVHYADSNRRVPGSGHTDFAAVTAALVRNNYTGYISLEVLNTPGAEYVIEKGMDFVRRARA